jgi:hypothetical protein
MRVEGWESLLAAHIHAAYHQPFRWGQHDCALWASAWVGKAAGTDHGVLWRGKYKTELGAARLMKKRGYTVVEAIADAHLTVIPVPYAKRGDLVLHPQGALGIVTGRQSVFLMRERTESIDTLSCLKAWTV